MPPLLRSAEDSIKVAYEAPRNVNMRRLKIVPHLSSANVIRRSIDGNDHIFMMIIINDKRNLLVVNRNQQRINIFIAGAPYTRKIVDFMIHGKQF